MTEEDKDNLVAYFETLKNQDAEALMKNVENYLDDEAIEIIVDHLEEFYGVEDDEELGMLAQIMISGFIAAKEIEK